VLSSWKYIACVHKNIGADPLPLPPAAMPLLVLALCFLFNLAGRGVGDTYMVFLLPLGNEFGWHRSQMTSVYSSMMVVNGLAAPLAGMVFERFGPRVLYAGGLALLASANLLAGQLHQLWQFYLAVGLLGGLGASALGMVPASALISRWFQGRLSTAIGLAYAGFGVGSLLMVPLTQWLIDRHGWREAYSLLGTGVLCLLPLALLGPWRSIRAGHPATSARRTPQGGSALGPLREALRHRPFWMLVQVMFFTAVGMYVIIVQSVAYLIDIGFAPLKAASAFGAAAMLSVVGVTGAGWLADRFGYKRAATASFAGTFLGAALLMALSFWPSHGLLVAYVLLFGICQGARGPITASLSARLFPGPGLAPIYGTIYACMSIGAGLGALLSGVLHDLTGGYRASFVLAMVCVVFAAAPFWTTRALVPPRPSEPSGGAAP
jgi:MFS family permease